MGLLTAVSHATTVEWDVSSSIRTVRTLDADTTVAFDSGEARLPERGDYEVESSDAWLDLQRPSTGEIQRAHVLVRMPKEPEGRRYAHELPAVVFLHGAGYGTADDSFGDVATDLASAGFVTATVDKPVWSTTDVNRDYPASAHAYGQVVDYLRSLDAVDPERVGLYAISEGTWIAPAMIRDDDRIAFQILLSPMVYTPRHALGFFVAQDFAIVGANPGYQSIVQRAFSLDTAMFGLDNLDFDGMLDCSYRIPTFVAYGSKDVMTAQVDGLRTIETMAHQAGNWDVTVRSYPVANHVLRLGDEAETGTPLADRYEDDMVDWAVGASRGLERTSASVAGGTIYQSIAVPTYLYGHRTLTIYAVAVHVLAVVMLLAAAVLSLAALIRSVVFAVRRRGPALGFTHGFRGVLMTISATTMACLLLFAAGIGQIVWRVVSLIWGAAPEEPGMIHWSWYVLQVVCAVVVWAWSRVFARIIEVASLKGLVRTPEVWRDDFAVWRATGHWPKHEPPADRGPVIASTRFGVAVFVVVTLAMFCILLVFAFWGLFVY